ncbi:unnamed protein product [Amaranthus hypochondriacus]
MAEGYITHECRSKGKVMMVEIDELSLQQAHRYVLLHVDNIEQYQRLFLNEYMASYDRELSDRVKQKWLVEGFPRWLQEKVPRLDDHTPHTRMIMLVGHGPNSINSNSLADTRQNDVSPTFEDANSVSNTAIGMPIQRCVHPSVNGISTPLSFKKKPFLGGTTTPNSTEAARIELNPILQPGPLSRGGTTSPNPSQVANIQLNPIPQPSPLSRGGSLSRGGTTTPIPSQVARIQSNPLLQPNHVSRGGTTTPNSTQGARIQSNPKRGTI